MPAAVLLAVWLGILTSISPCPLAANIAALSFVTKDLDSASVKLVIRSGEADRYANAGDVER